VPDVHRILVRRAAEGVSAVVVKAPFSSSGRARLRVDPARPLPSGSEAWLARVIEAQGAVVVEPWLDRVLDLGLTLDLDRPRPLLAAQRFFTDARGAYLGHVLGRPLGGLPGGHRADLHRAAGGAGGLEAAFEEIAAEVAGRLTALGCRGPAGVDLLVHRVPGAGLRLEPVVEVNPRRTMGHVALALRERLSPSSVGLWLHVPLRDATSAEVARARLRAAVEACPVALELRGRLTRGVVATSDPGLARVRLTILAVADDLEGCEASLGDLWPGGAGRPSARDLSDGSIRSAPEHGRGS
jgi:hypothetical protein